MTLKKSAYEVMGLSERASQADIEAAFQTLKSAVDTRNDQGDPNAAMDLFNLKAAHDLLSNPERRERYDEQLARSKFQQHTASVNAPKPALAPVNAQTSHATGPRRSGRMMECDVCGNEVSVSAETCPRCGDRLVPTAFMLHAPMILGLLGSALLLLGVFLPLISAPIIGGMNYVMNGRGDGMILLVLALASFWLTISRRIDVLKYMGGTSLAVMLFTFVNLQIKLHDLRKKMDGDLEGNPFRGLADAATQTIQLQYGWAVLLIGVCLLIGASILANRSHMAP